MATARPIAPNPTMPSVLPLASRPISAVLGHSPASTGPVAWYAPRSIISMAAITYSATATTFAPVAGWTDTPRSGACVEVDVVQADAEPAHRDEPGSGREQGPVDAGAVAHDQRPGRSGGGRDARGVRVQIGIVVDVEAGAQGIDGTLVHELGDDDVGHQSVARDDPGGVGSPERLLRLRRP